MTSTIPFGTTPFGKGVLIKLRIKLTKEDTENLIGEWGTFLDIHERNGYTMIMGYLPINMLAEFNLDKARAKVYTRYKEAEAELKAFEEDYFAVPAELESPKIVGKIDLPF